MAFGDADAYARFMGRFSEPLALKFFELIAPEAGSRVLDVGCGPGVLTSVLVERLGPEAVSAVDPSPPFVEAAHRRLPGVDIRVGNAEDLPYGDDSFDAALAQLVVNFMNDAVQGLREMGRVTRAGGTVAACLWDHAGGTGPLSHFWSTARRLDEDAVDESGMAGAQAGALPELLRQAGLVDVEDTRLDVTVSFASFDDWWEPYTRGVGPAGDYVAGLAPEAVSALAEACRAGLPDGSFELTVSALSARGLVAS
jgi:SAM-dependent methyltransferase